MSDDNQFEIQISRYLDVQSPTGTYFVKYVGIHDAFHVFVDKANQVLKIDKTHINTEMKLEQYHCYVMKVKEIRVDTFDDKKWIATYPVFVTKTNKGTEVDVTTLF